MTIRKASLSKSFKSVKFKYMTDDAYNDINGVPMVRKNGNVRISYKSTDEGFKDLIRDYGTHIIVRSCLGGRIRRSMEVDLTKVSSSYDVKAYVKASYEGAVDASAEVDEHYKESYKESKEAVNLNIDVLGGSDQMSKNLMSREGFTKENLQNWKNSVKEENMALVSFDEGALIPIYELVDREATKAEDGFSGEDRYLALKGYIDNNMGKDPDFSYYNCGTTFEFNIPTFENKWNSTLIKDIYCDGHWVAQVCNEYIPEINRDQRVTVVYPVIVNQPRYYMGFFLGNNSHKPARVSWSGTSVSIEEYDDLDFGKVSKLYLRGASIKTELDEGLEAKTSSSRNEYLQGLKGGQYHTLQQYDYPIVKIFNNIWIRENYKHEVYVMPHREVTVKLDRFSIVFLLQKKHVQAAGVCLPMMTIRIWWTNSPATAIRCQPAPVITAVLQALTFTPLVTMVVTGVMVLAPGIKQMSQIYLHLTYLGSHNSKEEDSMKKNHSIIMLVPIPVTSASAT